MFFVVETLLTGLTISAFLKGLSPRVVSFTEYNSVLRTTLPPAHPIFSWENMNLYASRN